jgi:hypothetical protein
MDGIHSNIVSVERENPIPTRLNTKMLGRERRRESLSGDTHRTSRHLEHHYTLRSTNSKAINNSIQKIIDDCHDDKKKAIDQFHLLLRQYPPEVYPASNRLIAYAAGKEILTPVLALAQTGNILQIIHSWRGGGKRGLNGILQDLWRVGNRLQVYTQAKGLVVDGLSISDDDENKDLKLSHVLESTINALFMHVVKGEHGLLSAGAAGGTFKDVDTLGTQLLSILDNQKISINKRKAFLNLLNMGNQTLFTRCGTLAIPEPFSVAKGGCDGLIISEMCPGASSLIKQFEYDRTIRISLLDDGSVETTIAQPLTFKEVVDVDHYLGTCLIDSTLNFNKDGKCISLAQSLRPAEIRKSPL